MPLLDWPTDLPDVVECDLWLDDPSVINSSPFDGSTEVASLPPIWHGLMSWGVLKGATRIHRLDSWLHRLLPATGNAVQFPLLKYRTPAGTMAGTIRFFGNHLEGDTSLSIEGNTGGGFGRGDFIQIGNPPHVYQVVAGGIDAITIMPPLKRPRSDQDIINYLGDGTGSSLPFPLKTPMYLVPPLSPNPMVPGKYTRGRSVEFLQALRPDTL